MIDVEQFADHLGLTERSVRSQGPLTWERVSDWTRAGRMPSRGERGGGMADGEPDDRIDDRREDAAAARYHDELAKLTARVDADLARIRRIIGICNPPVAKQLATRDMLAAQAAADGWCVSCLRDDQHLEPIACRPSGVPYYRDRCRACGEWRAAQGEDPPVDVLRARHEGRRIRVKA